MAKPFNDLSWIIEKIKKSENIYSTPCEELKDKIIDNINSLKEQVEKDDSGLPEVAKKAIADCSPHNFENLLSEVKRNKLLKKLKPLAITISKQIKELNELVQSLMEYNEKLEKVSSDQNQQKEEIKQLIQSITQKVNSSSILEKSFLNFIAYINENDHSKATLKKLKDFNWLISHFGNLHYQNNLREFKKTLFLLDNEKFARLIAQAEIQQNHKNYHNYENRIRIMNNIIRSSLIFGFLIFIPIDGSNFMGYWYLLFITLALFFSTLIIGNGVLLAFATVVVLSALIGISIALPCFIFKQIFQAKQNELITISDENGDVPELSCVENSENKLYSFKGKTKGLNFFEKEFKAEGELHKFIKQELSGINIAKTINS